MTFSHRKWLHVTEEVSKKRLKKVSYGRVWQAQFWVHPGAVLEENVEEDPGVEDSQSEERRLVQDKQP